MVVILKEHVGDMDLKKIVTLAVVMMVCNYYPIIARNLW
jgi:hypothetical protein